MAPAYRLCPVGYGARIAHEGKASCVTDRPSPKRIDLEGRQGIGASARNCYAILHEALPHGHVDEGHDDLIAALDASDAPAAERAAIAHIEHARSIVMARIVSGSANLPISSPL